MNDANTIFGPEACAERREDIALYAAGTLPPDEAQQLEAHFEAHSACRELLEAHRRVLKLVHEESLPGDAVDQAKVLRELKRRMAVESRVSLVPAQAALSRRGRIVWFVSILAVVMGICAGIAVMTYAPPEGLGGPDAPVRPKPVATYFAPGSAQGKPVAESDRIEAKGGIVRIVFAGGTEARLRDGSAARVTGAQAMELLAGEAAINVPKGRGGFKATAGRSRVEAPDELASRFLVRRTEGAVLTVVADGEASMRAGEGQPLVVPAGSSALCSDAGELIVVSDINLQKTFEWVMARPAESLHCLLLAKDIERGRVLRLVAAIENSGEQAIPVARYFPMGVNYQLQDHSFGQAGLAFRKVNPVEIRKRKKDGTVETIRPISGSLELEPGDRYELEIDTSGLADPKPAEVSFHYLSFGEEGGGWGFALKSKPLKLVEPEALEEKTPPRDGEAKTP